jgi:hypothetical protein
MKLVYKICLVNVILAVLVAVLFSLSFRVSDYNGFTSILGLVSLFGSVVDILIALILFLFKRKVWVQGYLLSAGVLLLLGFALCSLVY